MEPLPTEVRRPISLSAAAAAGARSWARGAPASAPGHARRIVVVIVMRTPLLPATDPGVASEATAPVGAARQGAAHRHRPSALRAGHRRRRRRAAAGGTRAAAGREV